MSLSHHLHFLPLVGNMKRRSVPRAWSAGSYYSWDTVTHINVKRRLRPYCNSKLRKNIWNHLELYFSTLSVHSVPSTWSWAVRTKERTSCGYIKIAILSKDKLLHSFLRQMLRNLNWNLQIVSHVFSFTKAIYIYDIDIWKLYRLIFEHPASFQSLRQMVKENPKWLLTRNGMKSAELWGGAVSLVLLQDEKPRPPLLRFLSRLSSSLQVLSNRTQPPR